MRREYNKNKKRIKSNNRKNVFFKVLKNIFLYGSVAFVVLLFGLLGYFYKEYKPVLQDVYDSAMSKIEGIEKEDFKERANSVIYDSNGEVIKKLNVHDFTYIEYKDVPQVVEDALLSIEDIRYYEHEGVDLKSIGRAGYHLVRNKGEITQGGSTITQQLVKLKFLTLEKTYERKLQEVIIAYNLEKKFSKTEILEFYLNIINYGNGAYGIESASKNYFNKSVSELSLSQVAFLTGIPNNPTMYSPINNFENAIKRRNLILKQMLKYEKITEKEYSEAIKEEIILELSESKYAPDSYDVSFIISSAAKEIMRTNGFDFKYWFDTVEERNNYLQEYNSEFKEAEHIVRNSGFKIYSTIDKEKQNLLQLTIDNELKGFTGIDPNNGLYKTQASAVSIDNVKNEIVAIIGGRSQQGIANTYNRAFLSNRQPGSVIKPLLVYLPAMEKGVLGNNVFDDTKEPKGPANVDNRYRGKMNVREAVARSVNTIPYKIINNYGARNFLGYLEDMEFSGLDPRDNNNSVSIGGFTYGSNTYEIANAFHTVANDGEFIRMTGVRKIIDRYGDVFYEDEKSGKAVFDSGTSYLMTDILKGVFNESYGTAHSNKLKRDDIEYAGKTGTTIGYRDLWFAGYSPYFTTVVWLGNDTPQPLKNGGNYTRAIWKSYMDNIHVGLEAKKFTMPNRVMMAYVNPKTGEVSKTEKSGWIRQLVTAVYLEKLSAEKAEREAKARAEEMARQMKEKEERERLAMERKAELKRLGMTEEDVVEELRKGKELLNDLIYLDIEKISDYDAVVVPLLTKVNGSLSVIKFKENLEILKGIYNEESDRLLNKKKKLEQIKIDEEKRKIQMQKEIEAQEKAADEKLRAEEEERIKREVEERLAKEKNLLEEELNKKYEEEKKRKEIEDKKGEEENKKKEEETNNIETENNSDSEENSE